MMLGQPLIAEKALRLGGQTRIQVRIGFSFGTDASQIRRVLFELAASEPGVCADPEPTVRFRTIGSRSMDFELTCWADSARHRDEVAESLNSSIYRVFMSAGCGHQVVYTIWS